MALALPDINPASPPSPANPPDSNAGNIDFFFNLGDNNASSKFNNLDPNFTVFGQVASPADLATLHKLVNLATPVPVTQQVTGAQSNPQTNSNMPVVPPTVPPTGWATGTVTGVDSTNGDAITTISIDDGGSGYTGTSATVNIVPFPGALGSSATATGTTATATIDNGKVTAVSIQSSDPGSGYKTGEKVLITNPNSPVSTSLSSSLAFTSASIDPSQSEQLTYSVVSFSDPKGILAPITPAAGTGTLGTGATAGEVTDKSISNFGSGYKPNSTLPVTFSAPGGGGIAATGTATIDSTGKVSNIVVDTPGSGYTSAPTFTVQSTGAPTLVDNYLDLAYNASNHGTATITVQAVDASGGVVQTTFTVTN
jgi:hypothetical protein